jgi:hypothetical protein
MHGPRIVELVRHTRAALAAGTRLFMLSYHSSSLLPGATRVAAALALGQNASDM